MRDFFFKKQEIQNRITDEINEREREREREREKQAVEQAKKDEELRRLEKEEAKKKAQEAQEAQEAQRQVKPKVEPIAKDYGGGEDFNIPGRVVEFKGIVSLMQNKREASEGYN
jgi:hypothetical protein